MTIAIPRRSRAGQADHPGRARRRHPLPARDMRDVPIPRPTAPPPATRDGTRRVWAPWARRWEVWCGPCELCDRVAPIVWPDGRYCLGCVQLGRTR